MGPKTLKSDVVCGQWAVELMNEGDLGCEVIYTHGVWQIAYLSSR